MDTRISNHHLTLNEREDKDMKKLLLVTILFSFVIANEVAADDTNPISIWWVQSVGDARVWIRTEPSGHSQPCAYPDQFEHNNATESGASKILAMALLASAMDKKVVLSVSGCTAGGLSIFDNIRILQ